MSAGLKLKERFPRIRENEPLKNHCTFRVGGPADFFYEMFNGDELLRLAETAEEEGIAYRLIGRGTNILFTDKGFRGLIIKNLSNKMSIDGEEIKADSGVLLSQIIRFAAENNLTGLEPLYGLPGSIGGAVWGNAGIPGTEIGKFITKVRVFHYRKGIMEVPSDDLIFDYRHSSLQNDECLVMSVHLKLQKGSADASRERMKKIDEIRRGKQPLGYTAGSFFKNPSPEKPAGLLIDLAGLKGMRVGDAEISAKHANFFVNIKEATAEQILGLAEMAKKKVAERFGIRLEMEVKIVGEL